MIRSATTWLVPALLASTVSGAPASKPIDAGVPSATATLKPLGSSPSLLKVPSQLLQEYRAGEFVVAKAAPSVDFALLPMQKPISGSDTWLFSAWGDIAFGSDGNFYVGMGDHQALPGHAWVFQVNPRSRRIRTVVDVNKALRPKKGMCAPGKIHAPMIDIGEHLYLIPYRGSRKYCDTRYGFKGEHLMRYHYKTGLTEDLGIPIPNCSVAQMNYHAASNRLYMFGAWCPAQKNPKVSRFAVYDIEKQKTIYLSDRDVEPYGSLRCMIVAPDGRAWYMTGHIATDERGRDVETYKGRYALYDPKENRARMTDLTPPASPDDPHGYMRAASEPDDNGIVWCISKEWGLGTPDPQHGAIIPFDTRTGRFGKSRGHCFAHSTLKRRVSLYTAVAKLDPTKTKVYYIPSAHGGASRHGAALVQYDTGTNTRKVVAFLFDHIKSKTGYGLGGTYGIAVSKDGSKVCVNWMDERDRRKKEAERRTAVTIVRIPGSER